MTRILVSGLSQNGLKAKTNEAPAEQSESASKAEIDEGDNFKDLL